MKPKQDIATLAVAVLLIATAYGLFRTRGEPNISPTSVNSANGGTQAGPLVDQSTLWTARWLAQMPTTAEERQTAENALHLADKDMDLAFAAAVREAEQHPPALSAEAKEIEARLQKSENAVAADQAKVAQLTAEDAKASGSRRMRWMTSWIWRKRSWSWTRTKSTIARKIWAEQEATSRHAFKR